MIEKAARETKPWRRVDGRHVESTQSPSSEAVLV
jgi:hypothetical protein